MISFTSDSLSMNKKFIYCQNEFEKDVFKDDFKYECKTCETNQICKACSIGCHQEHQTEFKGKVKNENEKCNCIKTKCLIQKKENENLDQSKTPKNV